ncbi:MAG: hypothetical protein CL669_03830, partial [Balneola sp.]|nr:hypothetical protein [Balneola sp.]
KIFQRKKLYGFDGESHHNFCVVKFKSLRAMNQAKNLWYETVRGVKRLKPKGYLFEPTQTMLKLYEANIPPMLRYFHIQEVSPSGWIAIPLSKARRHRQKTTSCDFEFTISHNKVIPLPNKETLVPYKICSFDIEASSSHGDFPLPKKNYKKLATEIVDGCLEKKRSKGNVIDKQHLKDVVASVFTEKPLDDISRVYTKRQTQPTDIARRVEVWIQSTTNISDEDEEDKIGSMFQFDDPVEGDGSDENENHSSYRGKKRKTINQTDDMFDLLSNCDSYDRDELVGEVTRSMSQCFPPLEGDKTTFIGSTFLRYGDKVPYLNRCDVLDTCDHLPQVENSQIVCHSTEKDLLLAWSKLITEEDPDIIIGYNIFGFDHQFLFVRSQELDCVDSFLRMSRNIEEKCYTKDYRSGKIKIEESSVILASGQHDLRYINMTGRLQIDLYNYFRRDYNLTSYKLDYAASHFIGDGIKRIEHMDGNTVIHTKNMVGLEVGAWISLEEIAHSSDAYQNGKKMQVIDIDLANKTFTISGIEKPNMEKKVRWGLAKDDVSPQDIFRMTNEGPSSRAVIAKYCIQDCNLVHHLLRKIDVITGYVEMAKLCSVPMSFLVLRGQGIKITSYVAKKCREKGTLIPVIEKTMSNEGYEGAIVLEPKAGLYTDNPVACVDYSSLYPSSMISENMSHDSKVWTKEYDLNGNMIKETGEKNETGGYKYDNLPNYKYVDVEYDTYKYIRKTAKSAAIKTLVGRKTCRFAQFPIGKAVMPSILEELLAARKATRKMIPQHDDEFMKNVLDKRQLSIKVTANSLYGQTGAKTSSFYEVDVAASTTATGRKLLKYAQRLIEEVYGNTEVDVEGYGRVRTKAEYIYGDTDSVFFTFNLEELDGTRITGQKALEMTIILAQQAGELATQSLKKPHDLEYEKTFLPFCLLSKKRYVGMLYETDPKVCYRKEMGIVLKRRDNAPIVKDVYGGIIDILMKDKDVDKAVRFLKDSLQLLVEGKCNMDKLIITKSLRGYYKNPLQIAHKVLADRMGSRDPGNKPASGDRIPFAYIQKTGAGLKQGDKIEHPEFIRSNNLQLDYSFYITNQIMKPVQQVFALVLDKLDGFTKRKRMMIEGKLETLNDTLSREEYRKKEMDIKSKEVKSLLFDEFIQQAEHKREHDTGTRQTTLSRFFG